MKRSALKLTICRETLRVLAGIELRGVGGASPGAVGYNTAGAPNGCQNAVAFDSRDQGAGCPLPLLPAKP